ncbi:hypothetical protein [Euzebya tangerina]|uniref:hypothetical protein n=1 Tax=Euzebya tangerina TaxID=591198 RepID=UPI000E31F6D3|nr:hypothetical protein [Euzebya tangerina]
MTAMIPPPPPPSGPDAVEQVRQTLDSLDERPLDQHVQLLSDSLDLLVGELDEMARRIPSAS